MVRASASQSVDLGFESYQKTLKMVSIASLLGAQHLWEVVENKPATSLLVVSLGKALNGTPHLHVEDRWPRYLGISNSPSSADLPCKMYRYNSLSREWRINMAKKSHIFALVAGAFYKRSCRYAGNKINSAAKKLNTTNINRKEAAPRRKIGLPLNSLFL